LAYDLNETHSRDSCIERKTILKKELRFHFAYLGIDYAGLHTDMQHMGYVLNIGETGPPAGLLKGLKVTNRMQDLILVRKTASF